MPVAYPEQTLDSFRLVEAELRRLRLTVADSRKTVRQTKGVIDASRELLDWVRLAESVNARGRDP